MKVWLTRDETWAGRYYMWFHRPDKWDRTWGYMHSSETEPIELEPAEAKELFGLKRHMRPGTRKIRQFELTAVEVKEEQSDDTRENA